MKRCAGLGRQQLIKELSDGRFSLERTEQLAEETRELMGCYLLCYYLSDCSYEMGGKKHIWCESTAGAIGNRRAGGGEPNHSNRLEEWAAPKDAWRSTAQCWARPSGLEEQLVMEGMGLRRAASNLQGGRAELGVNQMCARCLLGEVAHSA